MKRIEMGGNRKYCAIRSKIKMRERESGMNDAIFIDFVINDVSNETY